MGKWGKLKSTEEGWGHTRPFSFSLPLGRDLVIQAVLMAVWQRRSRKTVILHSDRGTQYTAQELQTFRQAKGSVRSMSGVGNSYENAVAERFFSI